MEKVDLLLKNVIYLDSKKRQFVRGDIAINEGYIVGINGDYVGKETRDLNGKYLTPGFINGHIHLESTMVTPENYSKIAVKHGTTAEVADPHEIVNILGILGFYYMDAATKDIPQDVYFMLPSCVPATDFDISAGKFSSTEIEKLLEKKRVLGLAEVMNALGVVNGDPELMKKIDLTYSRGMIIDGHAPGISDDNFREYLRKGHVTSDHECTKSEEALRRLQISDEVAEEELQEKLEILRKQDLKKFEEIESILNNAENRLEKAEELGLIKLFRIMIRQGTAAKDSDRLQALFHDSMYEKYKKRIMLVTDDKNITDLIEEGEIDTIIRKLINEYNVDAAEAYIAASTNAANYFGLKEKGEIAIGKKADLVVLNDLKSVEIDTVYKDGQEITDERLANWQSPVIDQDVLNLVENTINLPQGKKGATIEDISSKDSRGRNEPRKIIGLIPNQIITEDCGITNDYYLDNDVLKIVVMDIHARTGKISYAYLKGSGLKNGAMASTIAHDSHYLVAAGTNDADLLTAINKAIDMHGGLVYAKNGESIVSVKLEKAGLFTGEDPYSLSEKLHKIMDIEMKSGIDIMTFAFSSLAVIPRLKQLPEGTFEFDRFNLIPQDEINAEWNKRTLPDFR